MTLRAVVFDFDGVILDTESAEFAAWSVVFEEHGVRLDPGEWAKCVGAGPMEFSVLRYLSSLTGVTDPYAAESRARAIRDETVVGLQPRSGVIELAESCRSAGVRVGIASSSRSVWVNGLLGGLGCEGLFDVVHTRDTVGAAKPDPASYLAACRDLETEPGLAVAVEDSLNGLRAASAAGMRSVAFPNPVTVGYDLSLADWRLDSLLGVGVEDLDRAVFGAGPAAT